MQETPLLMSLSNGCNGEDRIILSWNFWLAVANARGSRFTVLLRESEAPRWCHCLFASSDVLLLLFIHLVRSSDVPFLLFAHFNRKVIIYHGNRQP
jgi:hypothetical protein